MTADPIARLKITLDDVKPPVLRRIEAPLAIRLDRLHLSLQAAMGWTNSHLYEIRAGDVRWGEPDPDGGDGPRDARKARLADAREAAGAKTIRYLYDFGDGWEHTIEIERVFDAEPGVQYPRLIEAAGRCPPEDVGGPWGHAAFLEAVGNPRHKRHAEMTIWAGGAFDPKAPDIEARTGELAALAKRWARKPPAKRFSGR